MDSILTRCALIEQVQNSIRSEPITALLGPRQCGKTTLARMLPVPPENWFDLSSYADSIRISDNPMTALSRLTGLVVIDEIQKLPELFPILRVLADRPDNAARFVILGSASPALIRSASESLAGRVGFIEMSGFTLAELDFVNYERLWLRGGFPRSYLAPTEEVSLKRRLDFIQTFINQDLRELAETKLSETQIRRLMQMIASSHGQSWNHSAAAKMLGVTYHTIQRHVEIFKGSFLIRELSPLSVNMAKRLRKAPRLYLRDSGLLHALLMIRSLDELRLNSRLVGFSWEGFAMEQLINLLNLREEECSFWSIQSGPEIDLVISRAGQNTGIEFKTTEAPTVTLSMQKGVDALNLKKLYVIYQGNKNYSLNEQIEAVGLSSLASSDLVQKFM
jgi:uncharacterized protein